MRRSPILPCNSAYISGLRTAQRRDRKAYRKSHFSNPDTTIADPALEVNIGSLHLISMSLSSDIEVPHFRTPSYIAQAKPRNGSSFQAPLEDAFSGEWFMTRSSNEFWKDKKNVRVQYIAADSHMEDHAFYQTMNSDTTKSIVGKDTKCEDRVGMYQWQGKGLMRVASARWEVLSLTTRPKGKDWMLVFAHQSLFTFSAINLMCRVKDGLDAVDMKAVEEWLSSVADDKFQRAFQGMVNIKQE